MIKIAVSACLLGENVRYDGGNKFIELNKYFNSKKYKLVPICPEVAIGMSIPRQAIQITNNNGIKLIQVDNHQLDFTKQMTDWFYCNIEQFVQYSGFILKSKSPSCGNQTTPHFNPNNEFTLADGLFVSLLKDNIPNIVIIDDVKINKNRDLETFISQLKQN